MKYWMFLLQVLIVLICLPCLAIMGIWWFVSDLIKSKGEMK